MIWNIDNPPFTTALAAGKEQFSTANADKLFGKGQYMILDIIQLRSIGILPISVDKSEF